MLYADHNRFRFKYLYLSCNLKPIAPKLCHVWYLSGYMNATLNGFIVGRVYASDTDVILTNGSLVAVTAERGTTQWQTWQFSSVPVRDEDRPKGQRLQSPAPASKQSSAPLTATQRFDSGVCQVWNRKMGKLWLLLSIDQEKYTALYDLHEKIFAQNKKRFSHILCLG